MAQRIPDYFEIPRDLLGVRYTFRDEMAIFMAETRETRQLLDDARRGDRRSFDELTSRVRRALLGWLGRQLSGPLGKKLDPEDVLQEVLLRAFRSFRDFRGEDEGSFRCWLEGIGRNVIRNHSRLQGWRRELHVERDVPAEDVEISNFEWQRAELLRRRGGHLHKYRSDRIKR